MFDFLIVGAGLFGATCARLLSEAGKSVQVIEKRGKIGGNCADYLTPSAFPEREGESQPLLVNMYGGHIFHTNSRKIWEFVNRFSEFRGYEHRVKAKVGAMGTSGKVYSFPINLMTLQEIYGVRSPEEAMQVLVGGVSLTPLLYKMFFEGYSKKQWAGAAPKGAIERIPVRLTWDDRYYSSDFQGMPELGYSAMIGKMLEDIPVSCGVDYLKNRNDWNGTARAMGTSGVIYSGPIDALFDYDEGALPYRSLRWESEWMEGDFQGCATVNYCDEDVPFTRILEWQHYGHRSRPGKSLITREYAEAFEPGKNDPIYPVSGWGNEHLYDSYKKRIPEGMWVGGRLGSYRYMDMDQTIGQAMVMVEKIKSFQRGDAETEHAESAEKTLFEGRANG
jgi:UDP-galactopyranose mutase